MYDVIVSQSFLIIFIDYIIVSSKNKGAEVDKVA